MRGKREEVSYILRKSCEKENLFVKNLVIPQLLKNKEQNKNKEQKQLKKKKKESDLLKEIYKSFYLQSS